MSIKTDSQARSGGAVAKTPRNQDTAISLRAHANWRPGTATLQPFLDRLADR